DPDVRGWQVYSSDGMLIGEVDELLVDTEALKVRYLDVELAGGDGSREDHHILVPIGRGRLHELDDRILIEGLGRETIDALPRYSQEPLTREYEKEVLRHFRPLEPSPAGVDLYAGETFDDERFYGSRRGRSSP